MKEQVFEINPISGDGIDEAFDWINRFPEWIERKSNELCEKCATLGATLASIRFSMVPYTGEKDVVLTVKAINGGYEVRADGTTVLFLEFGSGIKHGGGHPENKKYNMGPGKYPIPPGKGHWNDPKGWYLPKDKGGEHTFGNPPAMAMYDAKKEIEERIESIVREVFYGD